MIEKPTTPDTQNKISKVAKTPRSLDLIAKFNNGYAQNWFFAVGEYFKDALDIKFTPRVIPILKDGKKQYKKVLDQQGKVIFKKDGTPKTKKITRKGHLWTQGPCYNFEEGHIFYDTPKAYMIWREALKHIKYMCEIIQGTTALLSDDQRLVSGQVHFKLRKNVDAKLEDVGAYHCTQYEFVTFLKTGILRNKIDLTTNIINSKKHFPEEGKQLSLF